MAGGISQYAAEKVLNALLNNAALGNPGTWYLQLFTTLPDANGENFVESGESRISKTANTTNFPAWAADVVKLATSTQWTNFAATETVVGVGLFDASTAGNLWLWCDFDTSREVLQTENLTIPANGLTFSLGVCTSGGGSRTMAQKVLDALLNGAALGEPATWHVGLFTTLPNQYGESFVESGENRISKAQNTTNFPAWASGVIRNGTSVDYPAFGATETLLGVGLWDAASAGNLWAWADFTSSTQVNSGSTFSIPANGIGFTMGVCAS